MSVLPEKIGPAARRVIWINAGMVGIMLIVSLYLTWSLSRHQELGVGNDRAATQVADARYNTVQVQQFMTDYSLTGNPASLDEARAARDAAKAALDGLAATRPDMVDVTRKMAAESDALFAAGERMARAYLNQGKVAGDQMMAGPGGFDEAAAALASEISARHDEIHQAQMAEDDDTAGLILASRLLLVGLAVAIAVTLLYLLRAMIRHILDQLGGEPAEAAQVVKQLAVGQLHEPIDVRPGDSQSLMANLRTLQDGLRRNADQAVENLRIRNALDSVTANVRIADDEGRVLYANPALMKLLRTIEGTLRLKRPGFSVDRFVGSSIGDLYDDGPAAIARLRTLNETRETEMEIGGRQFHVITSPIKDAHGQRVGTVGQWVDRTAELAAQAQVTSLVGQASEGDLSARVDVRSLEGFYRELGDNINLLVATAERGINEVAEVMRALSGGDLEKRVKGSYQGLFGQLKNDVNTTVEQLQTSVVQIREATDAIATAAREIASGNSDLSARTESQASSLEQTASSLDQLTGTVKQNADHARQANQMAAAAAEIAGRGGEVVSQVVVTMGEIAESSKKIADIIGVIDGIAFQTNILALNAAVEAARAGEQGRGFAVVAGEVRGLAQRSAAAAKEIKDLISRSVERVQTGYQQVESAGDTMLEIVASVGKVTDIMADIADATGEQSQGLVQVNGAVTQMDAMTQQNAALVEQAAAAAESLQEQSGSLIEAVSVFKTGAAASPRPGAARLPGPAQPAEDAVDFEAIILAHQSWKQKLRAATNDPAAARQLDPTAIAKDNQCALGKWIYGSGQSCCSGHAEFGNLKSKHAEFHLLAAEVAEKARQGETLAAKKLMVEKFFNVSEDTVAMIKRLREHHDRQRGGNAGRAALAAPEAEDEWSEY